MFNAASCSPPTDTNAFHDRWHENERFEQPRLGRDEKHDTDM
jgi:hypothetical protein